MNPHPEFPVSEAEPHILAETARYKVVIESHDVEPKSIAHAAESLEMTPDTSASGLDEPYENEPVAPQITDSEYDFPEITGTAGLELIEPDPLAATPPESDSQPVKAVPPANQANLYERQVGGKAA